MTIWSKSFVRSSIFKSYSFHRIVSSETDFSFRFFSEIWSSSLSLEIVDLRSSICWFKWCFSDQCSLYSSSNHFSSRSLACSEHVIIYVLEINSFSSCSIVYLDVDFTCWSSRTDSFLWERFVLTWWSKPEIWIWSSLISSPRWLREVFKIWISLSFWSKVWMS